MSVRFFIEQVETILLLNYLYLMTQGFRCALYWSSTSATITNIDGRDRHKMSDWKDNPAPFDNTGVSAGVTTTTDGIPCHDTEVGVAFLYVVCTFMVFGVVMLVEVVAMRNTDVIPGPGQKFELLVLNRGVLLSFAVALMVGVMGGVRSEVKSGGGLGM